MEPRRAGDPRRVGRWKVLGRLGEGGMGVVYLAQLGREQAALKVLRRELASDPEFRQRFAREARSAARVRGDFTARVIEADADADPPYLVTEYIEGPTLMEAIASDGPLEREALNGFGAAVAQAVVEMHKTGVAHRDLTPTNAILTASGPTVIDFRIARARRLTEDRY